MQQSPLGQFSLSQQAEQQPLQHMEFVHVLLPSPELYGQNTDFILNVLEESASGNRKTYLLQETISFNKVTLAFVRDELVTFVVLLKL